MAFSFLKDYNDPEVNNCTTYTEVIKNRVKNNPDHIVYRFLEDGINESGYFTYSDLDKRAKALGAALQDAGSKGDTVLLLFQPGLEYIASLFACFYTGFIGIPAYPPRRNRGIERIFTILEDSQTNICLISTSVYNDIQRNFKDVELLSNINWIIYDDIDFESHSKFTDTDLFPGDLALLQYTSGSTGNPKGVMITQENLLYNSEYIRQTFNVSSQSVGIHWLPMFHDMGLVGGVLQAAYIKGLNINMPPMAFLKNPLNWLNAIHNYRGTIAGGPNFAFDYCLQKTTEEERQGLDLSSIEVMFCGAEPIRKNTYDAFISAFRVSKFESKQLYSCYGMAETTLIVTGGKTSDEPVYLTVDTDHLHKNRVVLAENGTTLVGCGNTWMDTDIEIVDPVTFARSDDLELGEIWVSGPTVADGYWKKPEETNQIFNAKIKDSESGPFLRTGDLGFVMNDQLFITGRLKDLIIIRGINYYPNDIEFTIQESFIELRQNGGAAFPVTLGNEEKLVIVQELERAYMRLDDYSELIFSIRERVNDDFEVDPYSIVLVRTGSVPLTSSGKIRRRQTKLEFLNEELSVVDSWTQELISNETTENEVSNIPSEEAIKEWVIGWIVRNQNIRREDIDLDNNIMTYGIDSLAAVTLETEISKHFGFTWHVSSFILNPTINKLAEEGMDIYMEDKG